MSKDKVLKRLRGVEELLEEAFHEVGNLVSAVDCCQGEQLEEEASELFVRIGRKTRAAGSALREVRGELLGVKS